MMMIHGVQQISKKAIAIKVWATFTRAITMCDFMLRFIAQKIITTTAYQQKNSGFKHSDKFKF